MTHSITKYIAKALCISSVAILASCIDEETPTSVVSEKQVEAMSDTQESMLYGISSYMVAYNSWGSSGYYLNDWGFPCQMYYREVNGEDFPVYQSTYDYWTYHENGTYASSYTIYTWYFYYRLIRNCNNLIGAIDRNTTNSDSRHYLGSALAFRAMAYMDLARSFEFKPTGFDKLDNEAAKDNLWGLTVPIVTEKTDTQAGISNPRADFCTMYRFIMNDLRNAQSLLSGYNFTDKSLPGRDVVLGLMARAWMEIGSRLEENNAYINEYTEKLKVSNANANVDGYGTLGVASANDCYKLAINCTDSVQSSYTPVTSAQWHDSKTGFNMANSAWMWRCRIGGKEQEPTYYCSFLGQIASEPKSGLAFAYNAYRCIGDYLYSKISKYDWRKSTWIDPDDAGKGTATVLNKYQTLLNSEDFVKLPQYANLKFRPGEGNIDDVNTWLIGDLPVMRVEEMYFIKAEAQARIGDLGAACATLKDLMSKRYSSYPYSCTASNLSAFMTELMLMKRIEFWGEGICFFDYKRLNLQVDRTKNTNYEDAFKLISKENYTAPWMNYFIPKAEIQRNTACKANPDVSGEYTE